MDRIFRFGFCRYSPDVKTCLCMLSYLPWFKGFYELLNRLSNFRRESKDSDVLQILNFLLSQSPPKSGSPLTVTTGDVTKDFIFEAPDTSKLPTIPEDRNLTDYFAAVEPLNMILIFASMFFERRIIVTSKKLNLLTACTYGAASLLYPMHWQHMFVPIVPPHLLDFC
ncbi:PREDICTED: DENN domain-containing protein 1B-like, partial [Acropora digitifera]